METDIFVSSFNAAEEMHGLRYMSMSNNFEIFYKSNSGIDFCVDLANAKSRWEEKIRKLFTFDLKVNLHVP